MLKPNKVHHKTIRQQKTHQKLSNANTTQNWAMSLDRQLLFHIFIVKCYFCTDKAVSNSIVENLQKWKTRFYFPFLWERDFRNTPS